MRAPGGRANVHRMVELAATAERGGFDSVWVGDSIVARPRFEALTTLAAIAMCTERVKLGTAVYLTPLRHPVLLAQTAANVDLLSRGRFRFGIGTGPDTPPVRAEYAACGVEFCQRGMLQEESLRIMKGLWTGERFAFAGKLFHIDQTTLHPLPARTGGPPVLVAGASELPLRRVAKFADGWLPISHDAQEFSRNWEQLQKFCVEAGRDPASLLRILYVTLNVNRDASQAAQETDEFLRAYYSGSHEHISRTQGIVAGEPERCAEFLHSFVRAGVSEFIVRFAASDQEAQMDRLLSEVIPLLGH